MQRRFAFSRAPSSSRLRSHPFRDDLSWVATRLPMPSPSRSRPPGDPVRAYPLGFVALGAAIVGAIIAPRLGIEAVERKSIGRLVLAGVVSTVALFVRPVAVTLIGPVALWLLLRFPRGAIAYMVAAALAWAPWSIRNAIELHALVPVSTMG